MLRQLRQMKVKLSFYPISALARAVILAIE